MYIGLTAWTAQLSGLAIDEVVPLYCSVHVSDMG
jgi:hypothetical protein